MKEALVEVVGWEEDEVWVAVEAWDVGVGWAVEWAEGWVLAVEDRCSRPCLVQLNFKIKRLSKFRRNLNLMR